MQVKKPMKVKGPKGAYRGELEVR